MIAISKTCEQILYFVISSHFLLKYCDITEMVRRYRRICFIICTPADNESHKTSVWVEGKSKWTSELLQFVVNVNLLCIIVLRS